ncbi:hypothetical protein BASA50_000608 [Batrachochytrium salamandrivorans]|uniref:Uncharacterized protein n=1 Tax=Batrachochytrium salamandrivorans TaxID=1357716 RepID=A0ABQ8EVX3_9FUNG|nr:hypothetical protein BASA50_000608 [Batrachochytrium salamandrivorans]KAH9272963.1 hypothetical protein BASA83_004856 [Batrachochytrium salamandrivorans]
MKLVSFAVISLLAITVSAHKPKKSSDANHALHHNQNTIEDKIQELEADYKAKKEAVLKLGGLKAMGKKEQEAISVMEGLEEELKNDSHTKDRKLDLMRQSNRAFENWKCTRNILMAKQEILIKAMEQRSYAEMRLSILEENIEQQPDPKPDDESQDSIGASYDSNPPRKILENQIGEFCRDSADLSAIDNDILPVIDKLDDIRKRAKNPKRRLELLSTRNSVARPHNKLFDETKLARYKCTYAKEFQTEFGWMPKSSRASKVFKSFRKDTK